MNIIRIYQNEQTEKSMMILRYMIYYLFDIINLFLFSPFLPLFSYIS